MNKLLYALTSAALVMVVATARAAPDAADYQNTIALFKNAGQSAAFFNKSYAYAVFPTVGEGAFVVGGAGGKGGVFVGGRLVGTSIMAQVTLGFQLGGKAYSEIIFFEDKRALDEFESGNFEFGADASVVAVTAAAGASAGTNGAQAGASGGMKDAATAGVYYKGMAVFTIAKGGLMYEAAVAGQKFWYKPLGA
ncbi:MAG: YSC84-related protein [Steroidobacteraceae bacterium]